MPAESTLEHDDDPEITTTTFKKMISVQTYLLAFVISDFDTISRNTSKLVPQRLLAKKHAIKAKEGELGLITGEKVLTALTEYFSIEYNLPHMQQIAIPGFGGAMENWGLVIYGEGSLLYDSVNGQLGSKHGVGHIIGHEFAHQFFGNLVAPLWWSYVWLNEGFATYYAAKLMSIVYPEFRDLDLFVMNDVQKGALRNDASSATRPMTYYLENPSSIQGLFDSIAYSKSGSVLRMWEHAITEKTWKKGITNYLSKMGLKAATSQDLADALQIAVDEDNSLPKNVTMEQIVKSWSEQAGYPLLNVKRGDDNKITITQSRFMYSTKASLSKANEIYLIPINLATSKHNSDQFKTTTPYKWMNDKELIIESTDNVQWDNDSWIIVNKQQTGYYRINYDDNLWNLIAKKLSSNTSNEVHVLNRAQILDDAMELARTNIVNYSTVFKLLQYLSNELDYPPWNAANNGLSLINRLMAGSKSYDNFLKFVAILTAPLYKRLNSHDLGCEEPLFDKYARTIAINWACLSGEKSCIADTKSRIQKVIDDPTLEIEPDVRTTIYCNGLRQCNEKEYKGIWDRMNSSDGSARTQLLSALGCCQTVAVQKKYLESSLETKGDAYTDYERSQILYYVTINGGVNGVETAISFISEHFEHIEEVYPKPNPTRKAVLDLQQRITSKKLLEKYEKLLDKLIEKNIIAKDEKDKILEVPKENGEWLQKYEGDIEIFFKDYFGAANVPLVSTFVLTILLCISFLFK